MKRAVRLFLVLILLPCLLPFEPALASQAFDANAAASVWSAALSYIAPRALQPLSLSQMTVWGLNGLTALDPDLTTKLEGSQLRLYGPNHLILGVDAPPAQDAAGWAAAAARLGKAAYALSPALQRAGQQGVVSSFFDELFNHFDPYSRYETPLDAARSQLLITGLGGTGISLAAQQNDVVIAHVAAQSPAESLGLTAGTIVTAIDNRPVRPAQVGALNALMNGVPGTSLALTILPPTAPQTRETVTLKRALVPPQTVFAEPAPAPGVVALQITNFNDGTGDQFSSAVALAFSADPPPAGLVIDLRNNRGGVLRQAVLVADSLLGMGIIARTDGRDQAATQTFLAEGGDLTNGAKIVVLVDGQTASAAEILAAALADNSRAVVVGSSTLGKGLVQTVGRLPDGGELFVTWSRVLAPRGWPLQSLGVIPQFCTSLGNTEVQAQLEALRHGRDLMAPAIKESRAMRPQVGVDAIISVRDDCPADTGSEFDMQAAGVLLTDKAAYNAALLR